MNKTALKYGHKLYDITTSDNTGRISMEKKPEIYTIDLSFGIDDTRDKLFEIIWNELLDVYLINKWDDGVEVLIDSAIAYFGEHHKSEVLWKKLKITD